MAAWRRLAGPRLLSAIVDSSDDAIVSKTLTGVITSWNPAAERMYGYAADEIVGKPITVLSPPERAWEIRDILDKIGRGERVLHFDTVRRRKDGSTLPVSVTVSPIRDENGVLVGASSIARDITEQHNHAAELSRRAQELELANRNLETFSYSVAHDLRAPLRALSGFSAALLEEYGEDLGAVGQGYAERIQVASDHMATLIDDLLRFSQVAGAEIHREAVDLSAEASRIAEALRDHAPGRQARFVIQAAILVQADRSLIRTVLQNLLDNAWKFTSGQDEAVIEFGTGPAGDAGPCYYVRDNGVGFDPAYQAKLFEPFQRLHPARDFPGTGIGLASARQIVQRHGGQVRAEGTVGHGATFYFTLGAKENP
ncbi:MAG: PAS domain S-box protein [Streptosporangiaceae bacterium]